MAFTDSANRICVASLFFGFCFVSLCENPMDLCEYNLLVMLEGFFGFFFHSYFFLPFSASNIYILCQPHNHNIEMLFEAMQYCKISNTCTYSKIKSVNLLGVNWVGGLLLFR